MAKPHEAASGDRVSVGSRVSFRDRESNEVTEVTVVHRLEADVAAGKLSVESPVAKALLGARAGEDVTVDAPNGTKQLTILEVGYYHSSRPRRAAHAASPSSFSYITQPSAGAIPARS